MLPNDLWSACLSRSKLSSLARWMHLANGEMSGWNSVTRHVSNCASLLTVIYFYPSHYLPIMWNESSEIYAQMRVAIASIHPISIHGRYLSSHIPYMRELWCCCCCSDWLAIKSVTIRQQVETIQQKAINHLSPRRNVHTSVTRNMRDADKSEWLHLYHTFFYVLPADSA